MRSPQRSELQLSLVAAGWWFRLSHPNTRESEREKQKGLGIGLKVDRNAEVGRYATEIVAGSAQ
jgi:hypothetical protein